MKHSEGSSLSLFWKAFFVIALAVFVFSAVQLALIGKQYIDARHEYRDVAESVEMNLQDDKEDETVDPLTRLIDFNALKGINQEAVAWLWVPNVGIDYPVMHAADNDKYLHTTINGTYLSAGSIFEDYRNAADFSDESIYIFGHHMKDGSMFSHLMDYQDESVWKRDPYIYLYLPGKTRVYEIFSAHGTDAESDDYSFGFVSSEGCSDWLNRVKNKSIYDTGVLVSPEDDVLTLSTCSSYWQQNSERFVIHAKCIKEIPAEQTHE